MLFPVCYMSPSLLDSMSLEMGYPEVLLNSRTEEVYGNDQEPTINMTVKRVILL